MSTGAAAGVVKKPVCSFWLWMSENRDAVIDGSKSYSNVAKKGGQMWKALSESERAPFAAKAKVLMDAYVAQMPEKPTSPKCPRPENAYWLWMSENRDAMSKALSASKKANKKKAGKSLATDVAKKAGKTWKDLSESERAPFLAKAKVLKDAHIAQMPEKKKKPLAPVNAFIHAKREEIQKFYVSNTKLSWQSAVAVLFSSRLCPRRRRPS